MAKCQYSFAECTKKIFAEHACATFAECPSILTSITASVPVNSVRRHLFASKTAASGVVEVTSDRVFEKWWGRRTLAALP